MLSWSRIRFWQSVLLHLVVGEWDMGRGQLVIAALHTLATSQTLADRVHNWLVQRVFVQNLLQVSLGSHHFRQFGVHLRVRVAGGSVVVVAGCWVLWGHSLAGFSDAGGSNWRRWQESLGVGSSEVFYFLLVESFKTELLVRIKGTTYYSGKLVVKVLYIWLPSLNSLAFLFSISSRCCQQRCWN